MKSTRLVVLLIPFLTFSCQQESSSELVNVESGFVSYPIDINSESIEFKDQIESLELFGFEESNESLLKPDILVFNHEKGFVVIHERIGTVWLFNEDGTFKSKFNNKGQGPEEYPHMSHTQYRDGIIETYVLESSRVMQYDLEGNFINRLKLPYAAAHLLYFNDGYLLGMGNQVDLDSIKHDVVFADNQMQPYAYAMPFDKPNGVPLTGPINEFRIDGDKVLFNPFWTDSVYQVSDGEVKPYIHFDFGEDWLWGEVPLSRDFNVTIIKGKVWGYSWIMGKDRIEINYMTDFENPPGIGYIDRRTKKFIHYKYDWSERQRLPFTPLRFEEDRLVAIFLADELADMIEAVGQENVRTKSFLTTEQILQSENPVLVKVKFK